MKVTDLEGRQWEIDRRFAPWRRWIQPFAWLTGRYRRYRLAPAWEFMHGQEWLVSPKKPKKQDEKMSGWEIALSAVLVVQGIPELVVYLLVAIVLVPFMLLEMLCQGVAGLVSEAVRVFRKAPVRIDAIGWHKQDGKLASITILKVPGSLAETLQRELVGLVRWRSMVDPGDPPVRELLERTGTRVERHRTLLRRPSVVVGCQLPEVMETPDDQPLASGAE